MQPLSKIKEHEAALLGSKVKCNATRGGVPSSGAGLADAPYACIPPWVIQVVSPGATVGPHAGRCCLGSLIAAAICSICHGSALEEGKEKTNTKKPPLIWSKTKRHTSPTSTFFAPFLPLSSSQGASVELAVVTGLMDDSESGMGGCRGVKPLSSLQSLYGHVLCQVAARLQKLLCVLLVFVRLDCSTLCTI